MGLKRNKRENEEEKRNFVISYQDVTPRMFRKKTWHCNAYKL